MEADLRVRLMNLFVQKRKTKEKRCPRNFFIVLSSSKDNASSNKILLLFNLYVGLLDEPFMYIYFFQKKEIVF